MKICKYHVGPGNFFNWTRTQTTTRLYQALAEMEAIFAVRFEEVGMARQADVPIEFRPKTSLYAGKDANGRDLYNLAEINASGLLEINRERVLAYETRQAVGLFIHEIGGHWLMKSLYSRDRHESDPTSIMHENLTVNYFSANDAKLWQSKLGWSGKQFGVVTKQESAARVRALEQTRVKLVTDRNLETNKALRSQKNALVLANLDLIKVEVLNWHTLNKQWKDVKGAL